MLEGWKSQISSFYALIPGFVARSVRLSRYFPSLIKGYDGNVQSKQASSIFKKKNNTSIIDHQGHCFV